MNRFAILKKMNRHPWLAFIFFFLAGTVLHFAVESWHKALAIMTGAILIDIAVDLAFTKAEEEAGEID